MGQNTVSTGFSAYSPRRLERVTFSDFKSAGIDLFTDAASQNPDHFQDLENVLPAISGGFNRRWGMDNVSTLSRSNSQYVRMFGYAAAQDNSWTGTEDTRLMLATDNTFVDAILVDVGLTPAFNLSAFTGTGQVYGVNSRNWFYVSDGVSQPQKIDYSQRITNTQSNWGIKTPTATVEALAGCGDYTATPTISLSGGGGSGATGSVITQSLFDYPTHKTIVAAIPGATGSGYTSAPTVTISSGSGSGGKLTAFITSVVPDPIGVVNAIALAGNIVLNSGRLYGLALQNSVTGHVSDIVYAPTPATYPPLAFVQYSLEPVVNQGCTQILVGLSILAASVDPQVDTVVLMASSDGGDQEHMYQVALIPLSSFTTTGGFLKYLYVDETPDTYNDVYSSGPTLLTQNLWVDVDSFGNTIGIFANTPPAFNYNKPVSHQGRLFATDGKALYFSKSIDEVTTSTGLITSKWEEAWPGDNELDIAADDELITGLLSDGTYLYIGTTDTVYRLVGSSAQNFSIPSAVFRGVGISGQDNWSVMYKDNIPAGYMWTTSDNKIMFSDFNSYDEIGRPISTLVGTEGALGGIQSFSYGPYSFGVLTYYQANYIFHFIYDLKNGGWYIWNRPLVRGTVGTTPNPIYSYTNHLGIASLYHIVYPNDSAHSSYLLKYNPVSTQDQAIDSINPSQNIPYYIETSWLNLQDGASSVVLNELESWTDDPTQNVVVWRAKNSGNLSIPDTVRSGPLQLSPFGQYKLYLAGADSLGRYHRIRFYGDSTTGTGAQVNVLRAFTLEYFTQVRA